MSCDILMSQFSYRLKDRLTAQRCETSLGWRA